MSTLFDNLVKYSLTNLPSFVTSNKEVVGDHDKDNLETSGKVLVDYKKEDFRGFVFCIHEKHGLMLLHCTRKKNKPPHYQVPGGHVDEPEFLKAAKQTSVPSEQLYLASRAGAARELYEETGINVQTTLDRLVPAILYKEESKEKTKSFLVNEYKSRIFFILPIKDEDFFNQDAMKTNPNLRLVPAHGTCGNDLMIKFSVEHSGFKFEPNPETAMKLIELHSGGKISKALEMALQQQTQ